MDKTDLQEKLTKRKRLQVELHRLDWEIKTFCQKNPAQCPHRAAQYTAHGFGWCHDCNKVVRFSDPRGKRLPNPITA